MKTTKELKKFLSGFLCAALIAAMALSASGCTDDKQSNESSEQSSISQSSKDQSELNNDSEPEQSSAMQSGATSVGEGKTSFNFTVTDIDGNETQFDVHTDKTTVGEALLELELIAGEDSEYGLFVKTVNGVTLDLYEDQYYWAFYVNGEYAQSGVDSTDVKDGESYAFKAERG